MNAWQWECFDKVVTPDVFGVTNAGPLIAPVRGFSIARDDGLQLVLETLAVGDARGTAATHPAGMVRRTTEAVEFAARSSSTAVARGVMPLGDRRAWNSEGVKETRERARVQSLTAWLKPGTESAYTIDWLENVDGDGQVWSGTLIEDEDETAETRVVGSGADAIRLSSSRGGLSVRHAALEMNIGGVSLCLCTADAQIAKKHRHPGYIIYRGNPDDATRKKVRDVLAFCLGGYLVHLGHTTLCPRSEVISTSARSAYSIGGRVFEIPPLPPAPLGTRYEHEVDQRVLSRMADAIYAKYDRLKFGELSWAYWHAVCAPVHMAAAHFGAAIEALQKAYVGSHPGKFRTKIIEDGKRWDALRGELLKAASGAGLDQSAEAMITSKIFNLNQMPRGATSEELLSDLGLQLGPVERAAWRRRNTAAHGGRMEDDDAVVDVIRQTKLLRVVLCRMVLRMTGASEAYHDYYTIGLPTRGITEPVPSPAPPSV